MERYTFFGTPVYFEFLAGKRDLTCSAWAIPTRNMRGWKAPCYFMTDAPGTNGTGHYSSYAELLESVDWDKYGVVDGVARDPRCENCMTHCGYEPTASLGLHGAEGRHVEDDQVQLRRRPKPTGQRQRSAGVQRRDLRQRTSHRQARRSRSSRLLDARCLRHRRTSFLCRARRRRRRRRSRRQPLISQDAIARAQENLLRQQHPDGHWCGELIVDSTLCSDYVLFMHWLGEVDETLQQRCVRHILKRQLPDGGWNIYYGGPSEVNASVKAYFALKLAGHSPDLPFMQEARANILRLGGIPRMNTYSKLYLALLGQFPWKYLPSIPVEMILLPELGAVQHLPDVVLEPGDAHPARDHQSLQADARAAGGAAVARAVSGRHRAEGFHAAARSPLLRLAEFFPPLRSRAEDRSRRSAGGRCANARSRKRSAGCWSGSARGATASPRSSRRC